MATRAWSWPSANGWTPGIDDLGRVYSVDFDTAEVRAYDIPMDEVMEVFGTPDHAAPGIRFVTAEGFGIRPGNPVGPVVVGRVAADGHFIHDNETAWDFVNWSPDRSRVVRETPHGMVVTDAEGSGADVRLLIPDRGSSTWLPVWEDDDHLLVQFDPHSTGVGPVLNETNGFDVPADRTWLLRCSADTGDCEIALEPGWGDGAEFPVYR